MLKRVLSVLAGGILIGTVWFCTGRPAKSTGASATDAILIDPGHGGEDGGATAVDGALEKDINLAIGQDLGDLFRLWGYNISMTRESDTMLYDAGCTNIRSKKVSDMVNRLALYDAATLTISIHQNHFSIQKYYGAQVFYSGNRPESLALATAVREELLRQTQPENTRELKKATDSIFLLHRTAKPAILVECGFLSNQEENAKLKTSAYQQQIAFAVFSGYWKYITAE